MNSRNTKEKEKAAERRKSTEREKMTTRRGVPAAPLPPPRSLKFTVKLHSGSRAFIESDVDALISACTSTPDDSIIHHFGPVAACLFFNSLQPAVDAALFFWSRRLEGAHRLTPDLHCHSAIPGGDLSVRLRALFSDRVHHLLEGEALGRCRRRINTLSEEIRRASDRSRRMNLLSRGFIDLEKKIRALEAERELLEKRTEEFKAAMFCILAHLDGPQWEVCEEEVFGFGEAGSDWIRLQHLMERECRRLEEGLPIYGHRRQILQQIHCNQILVLIGETGSGKSTQLVQYLADSGLDADGSIICTQPRKIAATSLAQRVREESNGCYPCYSVACYQSYSSMQRFNSKVIFMTDHCLLQHIMNGRNLDNISYIVVDEAHERSLNTDLLLALLKKILPQRLNLRLIIMSATVDSCKLSDYFFDCRTFHVKGRTFPVEIKYVPDVKAECMWVTVPKYDVSNCASYVVDVVTMAIKIHKSEGDGAILAFLTSQSEVEWACENFHAPSVISLPLHGKLSCEEQSHVFQNYPGKRKVIFATNLAETSLTIPGVKYVIDSGMAKESRFEPGSGMNVLKVCRISQSSASQRAGRAGRTEPGICYRLYTDCDFQSMASHMEPEICKVHLGIAILRILSLGTKDIQDFDFVDAPSPEAIDKAIRNLLQLGALVRENGVLELTGFGHDLVRLGIEPQLGKLVLDAFHCNLGREGLVLAAVMANASSIFCRVGSDEDKLKSDRQKVQFCHRDGDLFTLLSVYKEWEDEHQERRNKWCWANSINAKSMRRCRDTIQELEHCLKHEFRIIVPSYWKWNPHVPTSYDKRLKMIILSALAENVAMYSGYDRLGYEVALTRQHVQLHPSCSLLVYGQNPSWVVFSELLSISNLYLVCVTSFDFECLATLHPSPPFDVSQLESRKMQAHVITGLGRNLLRRLCGKFNSSLHCLVSRIREDCMDNRIGIDADFDRGEIHLFSSLRDMERVSSIVNSALQFEMKCLRDECIEKSLFRGAAGFHPSVALFGAGAEITHLELDKRYLSVEVFHSDAHSLDGKELLMMFDDRTTGIAGFQKYTGIRQGVDSEKWGKITFLSPEAAEEAVEALNEVEFHGSLLRVHPSRTNIGGDKTFLFPAIKAKVCWPRRHSKGVAIVRCARQDVRLILEECLDMIIVGRLVRCEISNNYSDSFVICGLDKNTSEQEIYDALRNVTRRNILDVFLLRGEAVNEPSCVACEEALLREIAPFMPNRSCPSNNCNVQVLHPDPKDYLMKALITFDGNLHLEAATALQHIDGKVLPGCLPWQKIHCQQLFHSSVSCPAAVYRVIKKQLDALITSFKHKKGVVISKDMYENGSCHVKISSNATKTVAEVRKPLEQLMKGTAITNSSLTPNVLQILFSREGIALMKRLEQETGTYILHDKQNLNVKVFGSPEDVAVAEQELVQSLLHLHENKQLEIRLRGSGLPQGLMKEVVQNFGPDLHGLKEKVPGVECMLNTRRHMLSIQGSKELKQKVEDIILELAGSLGCGPGEPPPAEDACPICLCEVEDCYQLEACGHGFCYTCLVEQCESAIKSHNGFPLRCARDGCNSPILLVDLRSLLLGDKFEELFRSSLGTFVALSGGLYRFCPSPDCPAIYRVLNPEAAGEQPPFACGACFVETCRKCHLEYHPSISCATYKEFKEHPDASLFEWRKGKDHVKNCPSCGYTIEKGDGCNHIECKCGKHICWVCLECFDFSNECYEHLGNVHLAII